MENKTVQYKRTLRGSVGAGVGALFNGNGRRFYILEHKDASKYHKAGESQKIIIDQIELGRESSCQVRFDESFNTVSRRHAAIIKDGDRWKLVQLSKTNSTFLNGHRVENEWFLENGDEIQLSTGGPRLGFIVPTGKQSLVSSIKMTERLELFREQALKPYKMAIACLSICLVLAVGGLTTWNIVEHNRWETLAAKEKDSLDSLNNKTVAFQKMLAINKEVTDSLREANDRLNSELSKKTIIIHKKLEDLTKVVGVADESSIKNALNSVYLIKVEKVVISLPNAETLTVTPGMEEFNLLSWTGTGFMLNDGRFITARHVVDAIKFISSITSPSDLMMLKLNDLQNRGASVEFVFGAYSPNHSFSFTSKQCIVNNMNDQSGRLSVDVDHDGQPDELLVTIAGAGSSDWACLHTNYKGSIKANASASSTLKQQTKLIVLGYPKGISSNNVQSLQGSCMVASDGLHNGVIVITERNFEHGNSGGPAFIVNSNGMLEAVGIISAGYGDTVGFIVPISQVK